MAGRKPTVMTPEKAESILADYRAGMHTADIAIKHNVSRPYVSHYVKKAGVPLRGRYFRTRERIYEGNRPVLGRPRKTDVLDDTPAPILMTVSVVEIRRLAAIGLGQTRIAALLRCPYKHVEKALA